MKKITISVFGAAFLVFILILLGPVITVSAQPQVGVVGRAQPNYRLSQETSKLRLTSSNAYTIYLPIIFVPPPPSPKKGVGVVASPACDDLKALRAAWYLNWSSWPDATCGAEDNEKFVPRISNANSMQWLSQAMANAQASGWLIGFSEPNLPWQGNMSPAEGAVLWKQIEDAAAAAGGIKLVSPSPNQWEPGQNGQTYGHQWTWAMVDQYKALYGTNPRFDAIGWNIYKRTPAEIQAYLTARRNEALARGYDVPIWVLEYGGECWNSANGNTGNSSIMTTTTAWYEATSWIGRYAWFANRLSGSDPNAVGWQSCSLINPGTGGLTSLGQTYWGY